MQVMDEGLIHSWEEHLSYMARVRKCDFSKERIALMVFSLTE